MSFKEVIVNDKKDKLLNEYKPRTALIIYIAK
jgi:hypothetical protein